MTASSLADGTTVLCAEEDFTSVLFPFLADARAARRCAGRAGKVRVSFHHYNTAADVDSLVDALGR